MTEPLFTVPKQLTPRQQAALDYITANDGVPAAELGANWHSLRGKHPVGDRCEWCDQDGRDVLRSKALRGLVTYRRTRDGNLYHLRGRTPASAVGVPESGYDPATSDIGF